MNEPDSMHENQSDITSIKTKELVSSIPNTTKKKVKTLINVCFGATWETQPSLPALQSNSLPQYSLNKVLSHLI